MKIVDLMCEHMPAAVQKGLTEPYCIGVDRPHFSFCVDGEDKNIVIKYYKLIVASSLDLINDGVGDMYDSGLVYSSQTVDIEYNGAELLPRSVYYFRVYAMVGTRALKSAIGSFSTGIGSENRLKDHFISAPDGFLHVADVSKNAGGTPAPYFRRDVKIEKKVASAYAYTTALGVYEFYINGKKIGSDVLSPGFT
ncbi:MAG: alpha-L-rhamnosidase N-terminal domain-containing protein, partial [Clostridia bacterium]|nr:alpha-L-rhamnosidase N-terminal domain-containing protein [Clostridia bacterium]